MTVGKLPMVQWMASHLCTCEPNRLKGLLKKEEENMKLRSGDVEEGPVEN